MQLLVLAAKSDKAQATAVALRLGTRIADIADPLPDGVHLALMGGRRQLWEVEAGRVVTTLSIDFGEVRDSPALRRAVLATGREPRWIVDATGGLGNDAFVMASAGAQVELIERSPVVHLLLEDGLRRALEDEGTQAAASRMNLHFGEAGGLLTRFRGCDVVYLDPMYPQSGREGGKAKGMRFLRLLAGDDDDAGELLQAARRTAVRRVSVKRPLRAPPLAGERPSGSLRGKIVRFDLYAPLPEDAAEEAEENSAQEQT